MRRHFRQQFGTMFRRQRIDELIQIAIHDEFQLVQREVDPVIRHPSLREIVGTDTFAAITRADQALACRRFPGLLFA